MTEAEYREKLNAIEEQLSAVYANRRRLTEAYADEHPAVLPPPTRRSEVQQRIARCPRCGGRLDSEVSGAKK